MISIAVDMLLTAYTNYSHHATDEYEGYHLGVNIKTG